MADGPPLEVTAGVQTLFSSPARIFNQAHSEIASAGLLSLTAARKDLPS